MRKFKTKLASILVALTCVFACLGVGVFAINNRLEAKAAANTYTITKLTALTNGAAANSFYAYAEEGEKPSVDSWDYVFTFVAESGEGVKWNGEAYDGLKVKQPGNDLFFELGREAAVGDVLTIGGTFYNETADAEIIIPTTSFEWNGTTWGAAYPRHNLGELILHVNSQSWGGAGSQHDAIYLAKANGEALPVQTWDVAFVAENAENFKINGENANFEMKSTEAGLFISFGRELEVGEYITISGTFVCEAEGVKYVIEKSSFEWTNDGWKVRVEYTTYQITALASTADPLYWYTPNGELPKDVGSYTADWDNRYTLVEGEITLNGSAITLSEIKLPGDLYVVVGFEPKENDVLVLNGAIANETTAIKLVFNNCQMKWNGSTWETVVNETPDPTPDPEPPVVEYTTQEIGALQLHVNSKPWGGAGSQHSAIYLERVDGEALPVISWDVLFVAENAENFKINGENANFEMKSTDAGLYINFGRDLAAGEYITISGTFVCEAEGVKYVIEESSFVWAGETGWEKYVAYTTYETDGLIFAQTGEGNKHVYFVDAEGHDFPVATTENDLNWTTPFSWKDGVGVTLNGEAVSATVKFPGQMFIDLGAAPSENAVLVVGGTFYSPTLAYAYTIGESTFTWNGTAWVVKSTEPEPPAIEYTTYTITSLAGTADPVYWYTPNQELPKDVGSYTADWDNRYTLVEGEITLNGSAITLSEIKLPGDLYVVVGFEPEVNDVLVLNGAIANDVTKIKLVFNNCQMKWNGTTWETVGTVTPDPKPDPDPDGYTIREIGALTLHVNSKPWGGAGSQHSVIYLERVDGGALPVISWDVLFVAENAENFKINGENADFEMKSTDAGLYINFYRDLEVGEYITISGTFVCEAEGVKYVIEESSFDWIGEWAIHVEYDVYEVGTIVIDKTLPCTATQLFLTRADLNQFPIGDWDKRFPFVVGSGVGITLNGEPVLTDDIKFPGGGMYVGLGGDTQIGDVVTIGGKFGCADLATAYVIEESSFIYTEAGWINEIDVVKEEATVEIEEYFQTFNQADYYETEWAYMQDIVDEAIATLDICYTKAEVAELVADVKAELDGVMTSEVADAEIENLRASSKSDLETYKNEADYRPEQWTTITTVVTSAKTQIDEATSVTAIILVTREAKAQIDDIKTDAMLDAEEAVVQSAKDELATYKNEADYRAKEWAQIQEILAVAGQKLDASIGYEEEIAAIVAETKTLLDDVKVKEVAEQDDAVVNAAKADLVAYKSQSAYYDAQWAEIEEIIAEASARIDEAIGDEEAIAAIVTEAKAAMDEVLVMEAYDEYVFNQALEASRGEVESYYNSLDFESYTDDALATIAGYVATAMAAIDAAETIEEMQSIVDEFKLNVDSVEKITVTPPTSAPETSAPVAPANKGCQSSIGSAVACLMPALAAAVVMISRKKREN